MSGKKTQSPVLNTFAVLPSDRYFADMIIGFLRNEAASLILRGLDVSAQPAAPTDLARVSEPMFEGASLICFEC